MHIFNSRRLTAGLYPFSLLFRLAVSTRNLLYDRGLLCCRRLSVPVISVGNLTVGGTGKTPAVEYFTRSLLAHNARPAIITRGYGRRQRGTTVVADGTQLCADVNASGDEAMQLARRLPEAVVIAADSKARGARYASTNFPIDIILIDDGFQHRRLHRDLDIVLIDAPSLVANRWLLPAGPFREPLSSLRRAAAVILTNVDRAGAGQVDALEAMCRQRTSAILVKAILRPLSVEKLGDGSLPLTIVHGKKVFAVCGIAQPVRFLGDLRKLGAILVGQQIFPDHHAFTPEEIVRLMRRAEAASAEAVVITEKDSAKWSHAARPRHLPILFLRVEFLPGAGAAELEKQVLALVPRRVAHPTVNSEIR